jgi:N-acetylglucosamine kinase-like BadF-type ATPase
VKTPGEDVAALLGGTLRPHGLVLIAGTGSRCAYVPPDGGSSVVVGAWGSLFGDEGSGYDIGRAALRAVTRAWDGRGPATELSRLVAGAWNLRERKDLVAAVYGATRGVWRARIASLCPLVGRAVVQGDAVAARIVEEAAAELALMVETAVSRAELSRPARALVSGGVFRLGEVILRPLSERLAARGTACIVPPLMAPVYGALLAALGAGSEGSLPPQGDRGPRVTAELLERLLEHSQHLSTAGGGT